MTYQLNSTQKPYLSDMRVCTFSTSPLDRMNGSRYDDSFVIAQISHPKAKHLVFSSNLKVLVTKDDNQATLLLLSREQLIQYQSDPILLLGKEQHQSNPYLAVRIEEQAEQETLTSLASTYPTVQFSNLRSIADLLPHEHVAIAAHARSLFEFHTRHAFCGLCGSQTITDQGGSRRRCIKNKANVEPPSSVTGMNSSDENHCKGVWFPRSDPVAIMLVVDKSGKRVLLGRARRHSAMMYSCLAGFMEHGEGVEDTVRREVFEESGVHIGRVRFFGSQPWPYPYCLMLGCIAQAESEKIVVDTHEMTDVRWFTKEQVKEMARHIATTKWVQDDKLFIPPVSSVAGQMLMAFVNEDQITAFESIPASSML